MSPLTLAPKLQELELEVEQELEQERHWLRAELLPDPSTKQVLALELRQGAIQRTRKKPFVQVPPVA